MVTFPNEGLDIESRGFKSIRYGRYHQRNEVGGQKVILNPNFIARILISFLHSVPTPSSLLSPLSSPVLALIQCSRGNFQSNSMLPRFKNICIKKSARATWRMSRKNNLLPEVLNRGRSLLCQLPQVFARVMTLNTSGKVEHC